MSGRFGSRVGFAMAIVASVGLMACSGGAGASATLAVTSPTAPASGVQSAAPESGAPSGVGPSSTEPTGRLGDGLAEMDGNGNDLVVTLVKVFDPAPVSSDSAQVAADAKSRWFGVELSIINKDTDQRAQTLWVNGIGSDGKLIDPTTIAYGIGDFSGCTASTGSAKQGQASTWCGGFMVPLGVKVVQVGYAASISAGPGGSQVRWLLP